MGDTIKARKGSKAALDADPLLLAELGFVTDEERVYIGGNTENIPLPNAADLSERVKKSTVNITYYVNTSTGLDTNDGLTSGTAFKTIQKAIDSLPQVINHTVNINVLSGTYSETVSIVGFSGKGSINIIGDTVVSNTRIVNSFSIINNSCPVAIQGFKVIATSDVAILVNVCSKVSISYCNIIDSTSTYEGIVYRASLGFVLFSTISNKKFGIMAADCATIFSSTNTGTGNSTGLYAVNAGTIGKYGSQPSGTTAELSEGGGVIR